jgi:MarR family transcriptional regulator, negative regulator of the multidrug operon emrRAB
MTSNASPVSGPLELRAAEIEAAVARTAARFSEVPIIETSILRLLTLMGREISALLEESLRPHGLNETDFRILMCLFSQPDGVAHPSDLCAYVAQSPANMTRVADGLCERGLITRVASEEDRRRTIIRITADGEALARSLLPDTTARTRAIFTGMPPAARRALLGQLRAIITQIDRQTQHWPAPGYDATEAAPRAGPVDRAG